MTLPQSLISAELDQKLILILLRLNPPGSTSVHIQIGRQMTYEIRLVIMNWGLQVAGKTNDRGQHVS